MDPKGKKGQSGLVGWAYTIAYIGWTAEKSDELTTLRWKASAVFRGYNTCVCLQ